MQSETLASNAFSGRHAMVTGGTSGIGAATAIHLARLGATVHALGLDSHLLEIPDGLPIHKVDMDVTDKAAVDNYFASLDRLDILVPAAGITLGDAERQPEGFGRVIEVNLLAVHYFCAKAAPLLAASPAGSIVTLASMMSTFGSSDGPAYSSSKGAIVQLTKSLAQVYAPDGVRVNAVAPGWINTPLFASIETVAPEAFAGILARTPMKRIGDPVDIAKAIAFLCSDDASFITGAVLPVDGGYLTA